MHYAPPPANHARSPEYVREILGFSPDDFLVGSLGYMTAHKRIDALLRVVARLRGLGYRIKVLLVGKILPDCEAPRWIEELGLDDAVVVTGFVDVRTFREYLNVPDAFVALRHPSAGETSASVIKMMGAGKPVLVSDHYAFREFPGDACVKIPVDNEEEHLAERLVYLMENRDERLALGQRSRSYILSNHDIQKSARHYIEFASEVLTGK